MITVIEKIRNLVEDNYRYTPDVFTYNTSKIFTLHESNINASSLNCYKNGALWAPENYAYDASRGKVTVTGSLSPGDILEFTYNAYEKYSDTELQGYIRSALTYLAIEKYRTFVAKSDNIIFPTPDEGEENLIAAIASILIKPNLKSYRTSEITLTFTETESKDDKIKKIIRQFKKTIGVIDYIDLGEKRVELENE